jgi:hypothetical protein
MPDTTTLRAVMNPQSARFILPSVEPLESRIAPAIIFVGNPNVDDTEYGDSQFINTETDSGALSLQVGKGELGVDDTFILRLNPGDTVRMFAPGGDSDFIVLTGGTAALFFVDHGGDARDGEVQATELTGIALGAGAKMTVKGTVYGDVVTNLKADGTLDLNGFDSASQGLNGFSVNDVTGSIISGGKITNLNAGAVGNLLAGTAANGVSYDFFRGPGTPDPDTVPGGGATLTVLADPGAAGPGIQNVLVKSIGGRMEAGSGGTGAKGGSITGVEVTADSDGFTIAAGDGGAGDSARPNGGAGGTLSNIVISGFADITPNSLINTQLLAGDGGDSTIKGGAGGAISKVFVGYDKRGGRLLDSPDVLLDSLVIKAGDGGDGRTAGKGGAITGTKARISVVSDPTVVGDEIIMDVRAGAGGNTIAGGKAGTGGGLSNDDFRNLSPIATGTIVSVRAGDAGTGPADALGAAGGAISKLTILGEGFFVNAGNGSSGRVGGKGGAVNDLRTVLSETVIPQDITINSGSGGNGGTGNAGAGGAISRVNIGSADLINFTVNGGTSGNGGVSTSARGGVGGSLSRFSVLEIPIDTLLEGPVAIRAGFGGDGGTGGGAGGKISNFLFSGFNTNVDVDAGNGGSATTNGKGGVGGGITSVRFSSAGLFGGNPVVASLSAGIGGNGKGGTGAAGAGGSVKTASMNVDGDLTVSAGAGGAAEGGASGKGGSLSKTGAFSEFGSGSLIAGNAGATGGKAGAGGSILAGSNLRASVGITIQAGNGQSGGAGGNITSTNFSSSAGSLLPAPSGNILVQAGNGSALGGVAGKGGSINQVVGYASSGGLGSTSVYAAGHGGGATSGAAGGSVNGLQIVGGGADGSLITISAGDAGDATGQANGANGGSVTNVEVAGLTPGSILRSIAAGDGGNGTSRGGIGGSARQIFVLGTDIGDRLGGAFGYETMGGIFAGLGGTGGPGGLNGSVVDIRAESIASIVAGRVGATGYPVLAPGYVERVDRIIVGTSNVPVDLLKVEEFDFDLADGGDENYGTVDPVSYVTNNLIGFYSDPAQTDTNKFHFTDGNGDAIFQVGEIPIDGLVLAKVMNLKTFNCTPEAYRTVTEFFDYNNRIS